MILKPFSASGSWVSSEILLKNENKDSLDLEKCPKTFSGKEQVKAIG